MSLLGPEALAWLQLGRNLPATCIRLVLSDVDGVITRGEGQPADLHVIGAIADWNRRARNEPGVPAVTLCTGRQAPYVELMAQMTHTFLPCIFEHGAGMYYPGSFRFTFDPHLDPDYAQRLAQVRAALEPVLLRPGRAFVQPGKEATMTLYPLGNATLADIVHAVEQAAPEFGVERNVQGVEVRPRGIDKGLGFQRISDLLGLPVTQIAGVGDSDPDLSFLRLAGFSAAPANATPAVRAVVSYVARPSFGEGLLDILRLLEKRNRDAI